MNDCDSANHGPLAARFTPLENPSAVLAWLFNDGCSQGDPWERAATYALCRCTDTLVWGILTERGWIWSNAADPGGLREPTSGNVQEVRVFDLQHEAMLWRVGTLHERDVRGRLLSDAPAADPLVVPVDQRYTFSTAHETSVPPFVRRETESGSVIITPPGAGVRIRHYLETDTQTGALRVAASRMMDVYS